MCLGGARIRKLIDIVFVIPVLSTVSVCCCTLAIWYGPSDVDIELLYVSQSLLLALSLLPASGFLSMKNNFLVWRLRSRRNLFFISSSRIFCASARLLLDFQIFPSWASNLAYIAYKKFCDRHGETLPHESDRIVVGKCIFGDPGGCRDSTKLNTDTPVNRCTWVFLRVCKRPDVYIPVTPVFYSEMSESSSHDVDIPFSLPVRFGGLAVLIRRFKPGNLKKRCEAFTHNWGSCRTADSWIYRIGQSILLWTLSQHA